SLTVNSNSQLYIVNNSLFGEQFTTAFFNKGTVNNSGFIFVGLNTSSGQYGLLNQGNFTNSSSGTLYVFNSTVAGILNNGNGNFTNEGSIAIQMVPSGGLAGLWNQADLSNGGSISIVLPAAIGLLNDDLGEFENSGSVLIGNSTENNSLSEYGLENRGAFRNYNILQIGFFSVISTGIINRSASQGASFPATPTPP